MKTTPSKKAPPPAPKKITRVMLVDDHPLMRSGLAQLINRQTQVEVQSEAGSPAEALTLLEQSLPHLLITDITMTGGDGIEFIKNVQSLYPDLPILVISMHDELLYAERVLKAGARGYIMKEAGADKILEAVQRVLNGGIYVSDKMSAKILDLFSGRKPRTSNSPIESLTDREFEVLRLVGEGKNSKDIAKHLCISPKTVDVHRANIKAKLKLHDNTGLVRYAVRWVETENRSTL